MKEKLPLTKENLEMLIQNSRSYREIIINSGRNPGGGENYKRVKKLIEQYGLDVNDLKSRTDTCERWRLGGKTHKYENEEIFCKNSPVSQHVLRTYVERLRPIIYECAICGFDGEGWEGPIALELDHINGDNMDNRIENLRYLCPNCHATTKTYRGRNKNLKANKN